MRIAIVGTPRSGNTWVRSVLAKALQLQELPVHNYLDLPSNLPQDCIVQLHWYREPNFQIFLKQNDFRVVVLARHPLDVLVSVLHFVQYEPLTSRWLEGNAEIPESLAGSTPISPMFIDYTLSWGAENLLSVTYQWWHDSDVVRARYEELVSDTDHAFSALLANFGLSPSEAQKAVRSVSFSSLRNSPNKHGWQATPGLWRRVLLPIVAFRIHRRHKAVFKALGYSVRPAAISSRAALRNWNSLKR